MVIAATIAIGAIAMPATAVGAEAQIFYGGCDLFNSPPAAHFTTSYKAPFNANRSIVFRKQGTDGFEDLSPVPMDVREWRDFVATSTGTWEVFVRLYSDTGPLLAKKIQFVTCPGLPTAASNKTGLLP